MSVLDDRGLVARAGGALLLANIRFWPSVAPQVRLQLRCWKARADRIRNPALQALALQKLSEEGFNAEVAATLATLAPRQHRARVVEAIVAYEVMYDYLDGLTEQPSPEPLRTGDELYRAFTDAIALQDTPATDYTCDDGGYLAELVQVVHGALARLPAKDAISGTAQQAAVRCAEAQVRAHAVPTLGAGQLEAWAIDHAAGVSLDWREFLAGAASSVLVVHALIAAAADERTTSNEAEQIGAAYTSICALSTMLDGLVDHDRDTQAGSSSYLRYYNSHEKLSTGLVCAARRATQRSMSLRHRSHHVMTMVGVAAYYLSAPGANSAFASPTTQRLRSELQPLIGPTLAVMRAWRLAKQVQAAPVGSSGG